MTNNNKVLHQEQKNTKLQITENIKKQISDKLYILWTVADIYDKPDYKYLEKGGLKEAVSFNRRVDEIKKILNEIKTNSSEEEKEKKLLEQNILEIMEKKISEGKDYWEDFGHIVLREHITDNLTKHSKINELAKEDYKAVENLYWGIDEPQELLKEVKNGNLSEVAIKMLEKGEQDANIHYEAIIASEKMNKKIAEDLREENRNQSELLQELEYLRVLKESDEREVKKDQKIKLLETQLSSNAKPLSKKPSKLKALKEKAKTKIQHLVEKSKQRSQELIARIEVRVK